MPLVMNKQGVKTKKEQSKGTPFGMSWKVIKNTLFIDIVARL